MKSIIMIMAAVVFITACRNENNSTEKITEAVSTEKVEKFGAPIDEVGSKSISELPAMVSTTGLAENVKVTGVIDAVCQQKGCWMSLIVSDSQTMRVTFKDYGFFVPKDCAGKTAVVSGKAYMDTTSVEMLREYAKDDGQAEADIAKITEPEIEMVFEAEGVIIKK